MMARLSETGKILWLGLVLVGWACVQIKATQCLWRSRLNMRHGGDWILLGCKCLCFFSLSLSFLFSFDSHTTACLACVCPVMKILETCWRGQLINTICLQLWSHCHYLWVPPTYLCLVWLTMRLKCECFMMVSRLDPGVARLPSPHPPLTPLAFLSFKQQTRTKHTSKTNTHTQRRFLLPNLFSLCAVRTTKAATRTTTPRERTSTMKLFESSAIRYQLFGLSCIVDSRLPLSLSLSLSRSFLNRVTLWLFCNFSLLSFFISVSLRHLLR